MKSVAHRGNIDGPSNTENTIKAIDRCLSLGLMCEIDVRMQDGLLHLGHDEPQERVFLEFLHEREDSLFIHCKDIESLRFLRFSENLNVFGHAEDEFVITSQGNIFCGVGIVKAKCVCVMPELHTEMITKEMVRDCSHVITDYPHRYAP